MCKIECLHCDGIGWLRDPEGERLLAIVTLERLPLRISETSILACPSLDVRAQLSEPANVGNKLGSKRFATADDTRASRKQTGAGVYAPIDRLQAVLRK